MFARYLIAAGLLVAQAGATRAMADDVVPVPVRPQGFVFVAPGGPTVLDSGPGGTPVAPASRPDLVQPAVPVVEVMNGGGFGYTGFDYYNDQISEGRLGARRRPREYTVNPAYIVPPRN